MRTSVFALAASLATLASAKEKAVDMTLKAELYDSGARHEHIMALKHVSIPSIPSLPSILSPPSLLHPSSIPYSHSHSHD